MAWSTEVINAVWSKAATVAGNDPALWRKDRYGYWIGYGYYGTTNQYGWEIDHIVPKSKQGSDSIYNLQPLHWAVNRKLGSK